MSASSPAFEGDLSMKFAVACLRASSAIAVSVLLASCGGGGGDAGTTSASTAATAAAAAQTQLHGVVVDGYVQGATVFLDLNNNQRRDAGEPTAEATGADGS